MSSDTFTDQLDKLQTVIDSQEQVIADLQAELAKYRAKSDAVSPISTSSSTPIVGTVKVKVTIRNHKKPYLSAKCKLCWSETSIIKLLTVVFELMTLHVNVTLHNVLDSFLSQFGSTYPFPVLYTLDRDLAVLEIECILGKIYHDKHRQHSPSICTELIYAYVDEHPELTQFFQSQLDPAPYFGPN